MNKFWIISPSKKRKIMSQLRKIERFNIRNINNLNHSSKLYAIISLDKTGSNDGAPNLGVAAEDGYFFTSDIVYSDWQQLIDNIDNSWIEMVSIPLALLCKPIAFSLPTTDFFIGKENNVELLRVHRRIVH